MSLRVSQCRSVCAAVKVPVGVCDAPPLEPTDQGTPSVAVLVDVSARAGNIRVSGSTKGVKWIQWYTSCKAAYSDSSSIRWHMVAYGGIKWWHKMGIKGYKVVPHVPAAACCEMHADYACCFWECI